jgi:LPS-assembly protein
MRSRLTGNLLPRLALGLCLTVACGVLQTATADDEMAVPNGGPIKQSFPKTTKTPAPETNLPNDSTVRVIADETAYDKDLGVYVARGHVQVSKNGKIAMADTIAYNERTKRIIASGHVAILETDGSTYFGSYADITDDFNNGYMDGFRGLMADQSRLAANKMTRIDASHTRLNQAVYTPCLPCQTDPSRTPLWQVKAADVIRDTDAQTITYHNAWLEMWGVPVFWTPYFRHPDIGVQRQSGLLSPGFAYSKKGGVQLSIPYFQTIGPDKDLTFTPVFRVDAEPDSNPGAMGMIQYRERVNNGMFSLTGSMTVQDRYSTSGNNVHDDSFRGHIAGTGLFDLDENWRAGFDFKNTTDKDYLRDYHLGATRWLEDNAYAEGFFGRSYASAQTYAFQSTKDDLDGKTAPFVTPKLDYNFVSEPMWANSFASFDAGTMNIVRRDGENQFRLSGAPSWTLPYTSPFGDIYRLTLSVQGSFYAAHDINETADDPSASDSSFSGTTARILPKADLLWRYPFIRPGENFTQVIEPMVQVVAAPSFGNSSQVSNEDSRFFELDENRLFSANRFVGIDRYDTGSRVTYGLNWTGYFNQEGQTNVFLGQSYQFLKGEHDQDLEKSGINQSFSDLVGRATFSPNQYLDLSYRFRTDTHGWDMKHQEVQVAAGPTDFRVSAGYIALAKTADDSHKREFASLGLTTQFATYWSARVYGTYDIHDNEISSVAAGLAYLDECFGLSLDVSYALHNGTLDDGYSGLTTFFQISFKNLGSIKG